MAKQSLPGSMDLLLDTMCNAFGGVMFIAISLALTLFIVHRNLKTEDLAEKDRQELISVQEKIVQAKKLREEVRKAVDELQKIPLASPNEQQKLKKAIVDARQNNADLIREIENLQDQCAELERKNHQTAEREARRAHANAERNAQMMKRDKDREYELADLEKINEALQLQLQQTPKKKIHFAREEETRKEPYFLFVAQNTLYRLGADYMHSSREVKVVQEGIYLKFFPVSGIALSMIPRSRIASALPGFDPQKYFIWVMVADDSFAAFTPLRRDFRELKYGVHWTTGDFYGRLTNTPNYSESR